MSEVERLREEVRKLHRTNRKLHRRTQVAESFLQSAEGITDGWLKVLEKHVALRDIVLRYIVGEIRKAHDRAVVRLDAVDASTEEPG